MVRRKPTGLGPRDLRNNTVARHLASPHPKEEGHPDTESPTSNRATEGVPGYSSLDKTGDPLTTKEDHQSPTINGQGRHSLSPQASLSFSTRRYQGLRPKGQQERASYSRWTVLKPLCPQGLRLSSPKLMEIAWKRPRKLKS